MMNWNVVLLRNLVNDKLLMIRNVDWLSVYDFDKPLWPMANPRDNYRFGIDRLRKMTRFLCYIGTVIDDVSVSIMWLRNY